MRFVIVGYLPSAYMYPVVNQYIDKAAMEGALVLQGTFQAAFFMSLIFK